MATKQNGNPLDNIELPDVIKVARYDGKRSKAEKFGAYQRVVMVAGGALLFAAIVLGWAYFFQGKTPGHVRVSAQETSAPANLSQAEWLDQKTDALPQNSARHRGPVTGQESWQSANTGGTDDTSLASPAPAAASQISTQYPQSQSGGVASTYPGDPPLIPHAPTEAAAIEAYQQAQRAAVRGGDSSPMVAVEHTAANTAGTASTAGRGPSGSQQTIVYAGDRNSQFMQEAGQQPDDVVVVRRHRASAFMLNTGTAIEIKMITPIRTNAAGICKAMTTDKPGVYDSGGNHNLLIPFGSFAYCHYKSQTDGNDEVVTTSWFELDITNPDGTTDAIPLNGMAGADASGENGISAQVDDHRGAMIRDTTFLALNGALLERVGNVASGQPQNGASAIGQSFAQNYGNTATQLINKDMNRSVTLRVNATRKLHIVVDHAMDFQHAYQ